ncbi:Clp protease N-terminal domain-containing protein [Streptomyces cyanogenus]|uniref:Clp amino terminal domain protein n=1 Tax=Streptomyces cyanogenus TaxID=80860 RepID=A0ABX7TJA3_STRCY|nr:Clp protease N-terminal domain-containing protein [Streptomyces cyanogenus]QTD96722.1 Clp amino terminal domain protein [Streptomyces cyanogenus]
MFEKLTKEARAVLRAAVQRSERAGATGLRPEDLLLSLFDLPQTAAGGALAALGVVEQRDSVERALAEAARRAGLSQADADALADIGIDLSAVLERTEAAHGDDAIAVRDSTKPGWRPEYRPFSEGSRTVLQRALHEAAENGAKKIGDQHLLLALATPPGVVADVLAAHGATYTEIRRVLSRRPEAA